MTAARYRAACAALGLPVWRPGMLSTYGYRRLNGGLWCEVDQCVASEPNHDEAPDFADPATIGVLLAAVREAWQDHGIGSRLMGKRVAGAKRWAVCAHGGPLLSRGATEADALIAALEAAAARRGGQP